MDNASIHRSLLIKEYISNKGLNVAYFPAYSPEMVPIERYFSMLKRLIIKQSSGIQIDWKSDNSDKILEKSIHQISSKNVLKKLWLTFTFDIKKNLVDTLEIAY